MSENNLKVYFLGQKKLKVSLNEEKECNFYSITMKKKKEKSINHHILLLDVSISMENELDELKEKVKATLNALKIGRNNYVSVIIYSGHDEAYRIVNAVKCDKVSYEMAEVFKIIDRELYKRSLTVISEPLEMAIDIVKNLNNICNKHHIALFTDGCLVSTKWDIYEEEEKVLALAKICMEKDIFFNGIGFGKYYDRKFLMKLIETVKTGSFNHIDSIKDYYKTIIELSKEINSRNIFNMEIENKEYFILNNYIEGSQGNIKTIIDEEELLICTFNEELRTNFKILNNKKIQKAHEDIADDFLYTLALHKILKEDCEGAENLIAQTGDIEVYESISNSYSFVEMGKAINNLKVVVKNKEKRFKRGREEIVQTKAEDEKICLLEVLEDIFKDEKSELLWDYSYKYKKIGKTRELVEDNIKFIRPKAGYGKVTNISIGSKKLNIGLTVKVDGQVLDEKTDLKLDGHIFRQYNLILNGNINTEYVWCTISNELKKKFRKEKIIKKIVKYENREIVIIDLKRLKITNKRLMKSLDIKTLCDNLYKIEELKCRSFAVKKVLQELKYDENTKRKYIKIKEKVRKTYRVDETGLYKPLTTLEKEIKNEFYEARILEWKIDRFQKKKSCESALEFYGTLKDINREEGIKELKLELQRIKKEKEQLIYKVNLVRISCGLLNKSLFLWDSEKEKTKIEMEKILGQNLVIDGKIKILSKKIGNASISEYSYKVLTKCD